MTDRAAISAQLVDVRNVGTHKAIKLTVHVPAEQADLVMRAFGWPTMVDPVPVALARINVEAREVASQKPPPLSTRNAPAGARDTRLTQRAGILCGDQEFRSFLCDEFDLKSCNKEGAAETVRLFCSVDSRKDITVGTPAGDRFEKLLRKFAGWKACIDA